MVTVSDGDRVSGMTVSAFSSVSLDPPLVLVCLSLRRPTTDLVAAIGWYGVNVLSEGQAGLSERFAFTAPDERFEGVAWAPGPNGTPLLEGTIGSLECRVTRSVVAGDHQVVIGEVVHAATSPGLPVVYTQGGYHTLGEIIEP